MASKARAQTVPTCPTSAQAHDCAEVDLGNGVSGWSIFTHPEVGWAVDGLAQGRSDYLVEVTTRLIDQAVLGSKLNVVLHSWSWSSDHWMGVADALTRAHDRGVLVRIVGAERNSGDWYDAMRLALGDENIKLCPYQGDGIGACMGSRTQHGKFMTLSEIRTDEGDTFRDVVMVTSSNWTPTQTILRNEALVVFDDEWLHAAFSNYFAAMNAYPNQLSIGPSEYIYVSPPGSDYSGTSLTSGIRYHFFPLPEPARDPLAQAIDDAICNVSSAAIGDRVPRIRYAASAHWTPYSIGGDLYNTLIAAHDRGCLVEVSMSRDLNEDLARGLRLAGVRVYETGTGQAHHMKHLLIETPETQGGPWRRVVWTGSRNGTTGSVRVNDELVLEVESDSLADHYAALWDAWLTPEIVEMSLAEGTSVRIDDNYDGSLDSMHCFEFEVEGGAFDEVMSVEVEIDLYQSFVGHLTTKLVAPRLSFSNQSPVVVALMSRPGSNGADDGSDTPVGDGSNFNQGHPILFREYGNAAGEQTEDGWLVDVSTNAEAVGSTMGGSGVICRDDQRCIYHPAPDTAGGGTLDSLYRRPATGTWSVCFGDSILDRPAYIADAALRLRRWPQRARDLSARMDSTRSRWTDQLGTEYRRFEVAAGQRVLCESGCAEDDRCAAWAYAEPGSQGPRAMCLLKETLAGWSSHSNRTSGVKYTVESQSRRWGTPWRSLTLAPESTPLECAQECLTRSPTCRAWTFEAAESDGRSPHCDLLASVSPGLPHPTYTSGTVGSAIPLPEPAAGAMLGAGVVILAELARRRRVSAG